MGVTPCLRPMTEGGPGWDGRFAASTTCERAETCVPVEPLERAAVAVCGGYYERGNVASAVAVFPGSAGDISDVALSPG